MIQEPEDFSDQDAGGLQHAAEHERPLKKPSVLIYLVILFAAAFLLMAWSYFMQQRASNETIEGLKQSVSAMQSVESLQQQSIQLEEEVESLHTQLDLGEKRVTQLQNENERLSKLLETQEHALESMDWFWRIQREVSRGRYSAARTLVEQFQSTGLEDMLPTSHPANSDGPSPSQQYQEILDVLY